MFPTMWNTYAQNDFRCKTCGEYIYKGKKFNARKEDVEGEDYLGIRIYRFYIKVSLFNFYVCHIDTYKPDQEIIVHKCELYMIPILLCAAKTHCIA